MDSNRADAAAMNDYCGCDDVHSSCVCCGGSTQEEGIQQLSNNPNRGMERRSSRSKMRGDGGKTRDRTFMKNVKHI
ncbi:hypothetical protein STCU_09970 [Strigomonas culicis]|uniref:Uncharacterized protein n=1 Tax=Strigomonas culicis TaxID=28005 RepID=S9TP28_9TRYP|nr:hypothetical protein STCU_09970 [Strigomonas culicis]|eukprot:EPY18454.1 hypothetical protein STCU_09970 [Strigomonas culicis]